MAGRLEIVDKHWTDRKIFQGSATAYKRYCDQDPIPWVHYETPLWMELFRKTEFNRQTLILDAGAGPGKIEGLLLMYPRVTSRMIEALEPNPILREALHEKYPDVKCVWGDISLLGRKIIPPAKYSMVTANMLVNHLPTKGFDRFVRNCARILKPEGILAYTSPNPQRKAAKLNLNYENNEAVTEEAAPWGGYVRYYHRSAEYQAERLEKAGFEVEVRFGGYEVFWDARTGPKRMLVVARKK